MKYVTLQPKDPGFPAIVFCTAPLTHSDLAERFAATHTPRSAGFCSFSGAPRGEPDVRVYGYSQSLRLGPAEGDAVLIAAAVRATGRLAAADAA